MKGPWKKGGGGRKAVEGRRYKGVFTEEQGRILFIGKNGSEEIFMEEQRGKEKFLGFTPGRFVF